MHILLYQCSPYALDFITQLRRVTLSLLWLFLQGIPLVRHASPAANLALTYQEVGDTVYVLCSVDSLSSSILLPSLGSSSLPFTRPPLPLIILVLPSIPFSLSSLHLPVVSAECPRDESDHTAQWTESGIRGCRGQHLHCE